MKNITTIKIVFILVCLYGASAYGQLQLTLDTTRIMVARQREEAAPPIQRNKHEALKPGTIFLNYKNIVQCYDIFIINKGADNILETVKYTKMVGMDSGVGPPFSLLAAKMFKDRLVYVHTLNGKVFVSMAKPEPGLKAPLHLFKTQAVVDGYRWQRAELSADGETVVLILRTSRIGKMKRFEQTGLGDFILKISQDPDNNPG